MSWLDYPDARIDEVVRAGVPVQLCAEVLAAVSALGVEAFLARRPGRDAQQRELGMTFALSKAQDRLFPLDLLPRLVAATDWALLAGGLEQRARALNALLTDAYGERAAVREGIIPASVLPAQPRTEVAPHLDGPPPATVAGMDLLREADGTWRVLEDNLRVPSGIGYALLARQVAATVVPELGPPPGVLDPAVSPALLLKALRSGAPPRSTGETGVAVLSSGPGDSAFAEHRLLAARMDVPLLTPAQLRLTPAGVIGPAGPVDVIYRRVDHHELATFTLASGEPALAGLGGEVLAGRLTLANALGCGLADDKAVYAFVPRLIRYYLGEEPLLADVPTYPLVDVQHREQALDRLAELVVKPVDGYGGRGVTFASSLSTSELSALRADLLAAPERWVAQEPITATTAPTLVDGSWQPCSIDLRAFVVSGAGETGTVTLPALLTRVAAHGSRIVNSSQGGGCKDTWVLT